MVTIAVHNEVRFIALMVGDGIRHLHRETNPKASKTREVASSQIITLVATQLHSSTHTLEYLGNVGT